MNDLAAIAFDLDGTLVDTAGGIGHALNLALVEARLAPFDVATVRGWIGDGPDALIERALASRTAVHPPGLPARLRRGFDAATLAAPMAGSTVFDGIDALLSTLARHLPLVVVTNKPTPLARAVLDAAGLLRHVAAVHGADTPAQRKPSPRLILQAGDALGVPMARLLMVGDGPADLGAARAAGCRAAWAGWGYGAAPGTPPHDAEVWRLAAPLELLARCVPADLAAPGP